MLTYYQHNVDLGKSAFGRLHHAPIFDKQPLMTNETPHAEIGHRLEAIRKGFTDLDQKSYAAKMGFNYAQYNNWARGERRITIEASERLCLTYGLTLDWIYLGRRDGLSDRASKVL